MTTKPRAKPAKKSPAKRLRREPVPETVSIPKAEEPRAPIHFSPVLCILNAPQQELWSLPLAERLKKQFAAAGLAGTVSEAEARMRDMDRHHSTDPRSRSATVEALMAGETPLGKVIRGRIIA